MVAHNGHYIKTFNCILNTAQIKIVSANKTLLQIKKLLQ